jgi:hypothetical protein
MFHAHVGDQPLEALAPGGRRAGLTLIVVDDDDLSSRQPSAVARSRSAYCRFVLSTFSRTCLIEDWRMDQ